MRNDDAFANGKYIAGGADYPDRWRGQAENFRNALGGRALLGQRYGVDAAQWYDLFLPEGVPEGLMVFIHGGYWLWFGPRDFSHLASGALARGWACAMPAYTLAPKARISEMTREIASALSVMAAKVTGPLVLTGHSAGGHLSARMACNGELLEDAVATRISKVVPISPLSDLRPLLETEMAAQWHLDLAEARAESPALWPRRSAVNAHVWVGQAERPSFLDQARRLGNAWSCPVTVEVARHHFDIIDGLTVAESPLMTTLLE